ncbi:Uncharacterised protein [Brucella melitensis]|nr:Uncharacterised protein [Brucella melitensis]
MRARVLVGEINWRSSGETFSGLIGNSQLSGESGEGLCSAGLKLQKLFRVDQQRIGIDRNRCRNRSSDDLALRQQAFDLGVDQPLANWFI